jgi:hypothetical protein
MRPNRSRDLRETKDIKDKKDSIDPDLETEVAGM